jgi:transposase
MAKRLKITKSKYSESYFIIDDHTDPATKKRSTFVVERLGNLAHWKSELGTDSRDEVVAHLRQKVIEMRQADKEKKALISVQLSPVQKIEKGASTYYNVGYLYIQNILYALGLKDICEKIAEKYKFEFDLCSILSDLICTRIIYPGSKRSSFEDASHFLEGPQYALHQVYRALPVLAKERYFIESELYKNSGAVVPRDNTVLYYDCTNFYFEIEEEDDYRKYGKSKENRPNPIVQYGLFMDASGIPLADICFPGNMNEQETLRVLQQRIEKDFKLSRFITCTDAGLNGWENKIYIDRKRDGAYICTKPIKTMPKHLKEWATDPEGWKILGQNKLYNISELEETTLIDGKEVPTDSLVFYKDRWITDTKKSKVTKKKETLEEHLIVSFSTKYKKYQKRIRDKKLARAAKLLDNPGRLEKKDARNPRYYIERIDNTTEGEVAGETHYYIDTKKIEEEEALDGLYAITTDLEDSDIGLVIQQCKGRWEIEESFEIMKSEFKTRPIYVNKEESIDGHLLTCFMALLVYRILEKYLDNKYTCPEIIKTLRDQDITHLKGNNYVPSFTRTDLTDELSKIFGFEFATEVIAEKNLKKFLRRAKSRKITQTK